MDELTSDKFKPVINFLKQNLLIASIFLIGFVLVVIGFIQMLSPQKNDISFIQDSENQLEGEKQQIAVDVEGAVVKPGVYTLSAESRVQDALIAAGGLSAEADRELISKRINLAQKIVDGQKLYIPKVGENSSSGLLGVSSEEGGSQLFNDGKIHINIASISELDSLSGIGKVTAQKIIDNRPYATLDELLSKKIISQKVFDQNKEKIDL